MSSRRIQAMARLIDDIEHGVNAWYRGNRDPAIISDIAVKLAGYRRDFKGEAKAEQ